MDTQNSSVKTQPKTQPKSQPKAQQKPKMTPPQTSDGPEIWDGNNSGWTLVSYSRKKKSKK